MDLDAFDEKERHHIRTLRIRRDTLRKNEPRLSFNIRAELEALDWVFEVLEEISEEE
jgi:hypothetical protein